MDSKLHLCFLMQEGKMAGVEYNAITLAQSLDTRRFDVTFVIPYEGPLTQMCQKMNFSYAVVRRPRFFSTALRLGHRHCFNPFATLVNFVCFFVLAGKLSAFFKQKGFDLIVTKGLMAGF